MQLQESFDIATRRLKAGWGYWADAVTFDWRVRCRVLVLVLALFALDVVGVFRQKCCFVTRPTR